MPPPAERFCILFIGASNSDEAKLSLPDPESTQRDLHADTLSPGVDLPLFDLRFHTSPSFRFCSWEADREAEDPPRLLG
jgi:hypothetical protein